MMNAQTIPLSHFAAVPPGAETLLSTAADEKKEVVALSEFDQRLLAAIKAHPDRLQMHLTRGDPTVNHKALVALYVRFFQIANRHNIDYWLEYGSSLGYCRHRCIFPWEWDMDIGLTLDNYKKIQEVGAKIEAEDPVWGFKFYSDPDYQMPAYCMYLKENDSVLCDICPYREEGDLLVCDVKEWNYPSYSRDDILPTRRVMMMGESALVERRAEKVLSKTEEILGQCTGDSNAHSWNLNKVSWMQYDPVPFLMTQLFHPARSQLLCSPPCFDVPESPTIIEGLKKYAPLNLPFVVRKAPAFKFDYLDVKKLARARNVTTWAYSRSLDQVESVSVADAIEQWEDGKLEYNFTDSPAPGALLPDGGIDPALAEFGIESSKLMLVMSPGVMYTPFHQDPVALPGSGGGWMWLSKGRKVWNLVDCELSFKHLLNKDTCSLKDLPMADLLYLDNHALWGKVWQCICNDGDFIYFPPAMSHRVSTYAPSIGVGGYLLLEHDQVRVENIKKLYAEHNCDPSLGLWKPDSRPKKPIRPEHSNL